MKNTKKQKRPAAEEEAGGNKQKFTRRKKDFNPVKKERDYRRKPPKEREKTTLNASKTSCDKATSELAHNRYQTTALYKSNKTKQQQEGGEVDEDGTRKDQTGARPDRTGQERHTVEKQMSTRVFFFFFWIGLFFKMAKQCVF
jgi:hypothetical protein